MKINNKIKLLVASAALLLSGCAMGGSSSVSENPSENPSTTSVAPSTMSSDVTSNTSTTPSTTPSVKPSSSSKTSSVSSATSTSVATSTSTTPISAGFEITTNLTETKEIHTTNQANYLKTKTKYYDITSSELNSYGATGTKENSLPNAVALAWNYGAPSGKTVSYFSVKYGQKSDLSDGIEVKGTSAKSYNLYNSYLGKNYFQVIATLNDGSKESSQIYSFNVNNQAPRNLKLGNMSNCRDMGGRTTVYGGTIKQGLIYRTCGNKFDKSSQLNSEAKSAMLDQLKVKTEINVSDSTTYNCNLTNVSVKNCYMAYGATPYSNLSRNAEPLRQVYSILANSSNYPAFYHCRIGTDRTGIVGVTLNGLLGVSFNETMQDYGFSNFGNIGDQRYSHKSSDPNGDDAAKYIDEILKMPGENFQQQTYNALRSIGVPESDLNAVIDNMTEGTKPNNKNGQIFTTADKFTNNGGTSGSASDYKNPDKYITISSGKSVTATATTEAKEYTIVAYMGCTDSSSSKKLSSGIKYSVDSSDKTIENDKTLYLCGFGKTSNAGSRTGYMFQILGKMNFTAGSHTITIAGNSSTAFNIAGIHLIPGTVPTSQY